MLYDGSRRLSYPYQYFHMKHKLFSVLFAACAALFSVSGLTGCDGNGDGTGGQQVTLGAMTVKEFGSGRYYFELNQAIRGYIGMIEKQGSGDDASEFDENAVSYVTGEGMFITDSGNSVAECRVTYMKLDGIDAEGNDWSGMYELKVSFDNLDMTRDEAVLSALGIANNGDGEGGTNIASELRIYITGTSFVSTGNVVTDLELPEEEEGEEGENPDNGLRGTGSVYKRKGNIMEAF